MEFHWLRREGNGRLVLFVLGWSADHRIVEHICPEGCDVLAVYDYSAGDLDVVGGRSCAAGDTAGHAAATASGGAAALRDLIAGYPQTYLFAWSFGVWVAEQLLGGIPFTRAVALNGTPHPVHDQYGIEPRRMAVTIRGLRAGGMDAFNRRTYGEHFDRLEHLLAPRPLDRNIAELEFLASASVAEYVPSIEWDKAVIGSEDQIFPPENMLRFWGSRSETLPLPHYPFAERGLIEKEIGRR